MKKSDAAKSLRAAKTGAAKAGAPKPGTSKNDVTMAGATNAGATKADVTTTDGSKTTSSNPDTTEISYQFGYDLMGPVIAEYLLKLMTTIQHFEDDRNAKILFVSRAGIRIRRALETYLKATGGELPADANNFWISRLMVAKGTWQKNRTNSIATLSSEFYHAPISDLVKAMYRYEGVPDDFPMSHADLDLPGHELARFFQNNGAAAIALSEYFDAQSDLFETYLDELLGDRSDALLVDTGWAGSAQRLLADAFPDIDWWGAYFGRYGFEHTNRKYWPNMLGLVFEQDEFDFDKPETSTILHRHLIEDLFEPSGSSVERLIKTKIGNIEAPEARAIKADSPDKTSDPIFTGVLDYLEKLPPGNALATRHKNARTAWRKISRIVCLPTREETQIFTGVKRSADFGKTMKVPLLLPARPREDDDTPERRIKDALWQNGQAAIEYPAEIADPLQRKLAGLGRFDFKKKKKKRIEVLKDRTDPAVSIITRSLDRPMFLKRALESVAGQTFGNYVQIVVNDGGDNELAKETIEAADCAHHKIILIDNIENRGMEAASNIAIGAARSDYIVIHDDDDTWEPEFLEKTVAFLDGPKRRTYGGVISRTSYVSEEVKPDHIEIHGTEPYQGWVENVHIMEMAIQNFFPPIAFLFRRDIYDKIGGYNEDYPVLGDWDFNLRFLLESDIGMVHEPLANYHHRDKGDTSLFGNSVIAGRDKHMEYASVVRNRFARNMLHSDHPAVAVMVGMGLHFDANRHAIRDIQAKAGGAVAQTTATTTSKWTPGSDDYWVAMCRMNQAISSNDQSVLKHLGGGILGGLKTLLSGDRQKAPMTDEAMHYLTGLNKSGYELTAPPDFDEERYLIINQDVAEAVRSGRMRNGFEHYYIYGRIEGRTRPTRGLG